MSSSVKTAILGAVGDDEYLIREVCDPNHFDKNGNVTAMAIQTEELCSRGVSVHRRDITGKELIKNAVRKRCENHPGEGWKECVALFTAGKVREIKDNGRDVFHVIAEPENDNPGHANIYLYCSEDGGKTRAYARKMRRQLLPLLQKRVSVEAAFQAV